jgi:hypothetical protein
MGTNYERTAYKQNGLGKPYGSDGFGTVHSRARSKKKHESPTLFPSDRTKLHIDEVQCNSELNIAHYPVLSMLPYVSSSFPPNGVLHSLFSAYAAIAILSRARKFAQLCTQSAIFQRCVTP